MDRFNYIKYFETLMGYCMREKEMLKNMVEDVNDISIKDYFLQMKATKDGTKELSSDMIRNLKGEFIPIFEREDVLELSNLLVRVIAKIENVAKVITIHNLTTFDNEIYELVEILSEAVNELTNVLHELRNIKKIDDISDYTEKVKDIEAKGDEVYLEALTKLYSKDIDDIKKLISNQAIIQSLEEAIDACEKVAYFVEVIQVNNI